MRYLLAALLLLLAAPAAWAGSCAYCDPADAVVAHRVKTWRITGESPVKCCQDPNNGHERVCGPSFVEWVPGVPVKYWKCSGGDGTPGSPYNAVVEMEQAEKDAVDAANTPPVDTTTTLVTSPNGTHQGGMHARNVGEIWFGSLTDTNLFMVLGLNKIVAIGNQSGPKVGIGVTDPAAFNADDTLVVNGVLRLLPDASVTVCDAAMRGTLANSFGGPGVRDNLVVCQKDHLNDYDWTVAARP